MALWKPQLKYGIKTSHKTRSIKHIFYYYVKKDKTTREFDYGMQHVVRYNILNEFEVVKLTN